MSSKEKYLEEKVTPVMKGLMVELLSKKPDNPAEFIIKYLKELIKSSKAGKLKDSSAKGGEVEGTKA